MLPSIVGWRVWALAAAAASWGTSPAASARPASVPVTPQVVAVPDSTGPIPVTPTSWPFGSVQHAVTDRDLAADGYVEEEYFISGMANVYEWPAVGRLERFAKGPYTTRLLVRRPISSERFSGTVVVEALNPSMQFDAAVMWMESQHHFIARGDAYVGVTVKPVAARSLQNFDPRRYAALSFRNPLPESETCGEDRLPAARGGLPLDSWPATETGLIWDILSQTSALLRDDSGENPLRGWPVSRVYLTGDSQSGAFVLAYANAVHPFALRADGGPIYDGYLSSTAQGPGIPINQCSAAPPRNDPRMVIQPRGVPILRIISETDIQVLLRQPDSDQAPHLFRSYEVAGSAHIHDWVLRWGADDDDVAKARGINFLSNAACAQRSEKPNMLPFQHALNAAFDNMDAWSRRGTAPPRASPLEIGELDRGRETLRVDALGNAVGGLRLPGMDVPRYRYAAFMDGPGICELWGYQVDLPPAALARLYASRADYLAKVSAAVEQAVADRWLTREDAAETMAAARAEVM